MAKPTIIIDKVAFFIGIFGMCAIVFNLWKVAFAVRNNRLGLFFYLMMSIFSTFFFGWLITSNIRYLQDRKIRRMNQPIEKEQSTELEQTQENSD
jgi:hypothetical protein